MPDQKQTPGFERAHAEAEAAVVAAEQQLAAARERLGEVERASYIAPSLLDSGERGRRGDLTLADGDGDALKLTETDDGRLIAKTVHAGRPDSTSVFLSTADQDRLARYAAPAPSADGGERSEVERLRAFSAQQEQTIRDLSAELSRTRDAFADGGEREDAARLLAQFALHADEPWDSVQLEKVYAAARLVNGEPHGATRAASSSPPSDGEGEPVAALDRAAAFSGLHALNIPAPPAPAGGEGDTWPFGGRTRDGGLPEPAPEIVMAANGIYWRRYQGSVSMVPVSDDNDPVLTPVAVYRLVGWEDHDGAFYSRAAGGEGDDERVERAAAALCRFVFPGYCVPRREMATAALAAAADQGDGWLDRLPAKTIATGAPPVSSGGEGRDAPAREEATMRIVNAKGWFMDRVEPDDEALGRRMLDYYVPGARLQRYDGTRWVDVPVCEDGGEGR